MLWFSEKHIPLLSKHRYEIYHHSHSQLKYDQGMLRDWEHHTVNHKARKISHKIYSTWHKVCTGIEAWSFLLRSSHLAICPGLQLKKMTTPLSQSRNDLDLMWCYAVYPPHSLLQRTCDANSQSLYLACLPSACYSLMHSQWLNGKCGPALC